MMEPSLFSLQKATEKDTTLRANHKGHEGTQRSHEYVLEQFRDYCALNGERPLTAFEMKNFRVDEGDFCLSISNCTIAQALKEHEDRWPTFVFLCGLCG